MTERHREGRVLPNMEATGFWAQRNSVPLSQLVGYLGFWQEEERQHGKGQRERERESISRDLNVN